MTSYNFTRTSAKALVSPCDEYLPHAFPLLFDCYRKRLSAVGSKWDSTDTRPTGPHSLILASCAPFMIAVKMTVPALLIL